MPPLLGEIKGTPTIRFYKPKAKQGNSDRKKIVLDYNGERKAVNMKAFADGQMPNFVEKVASGKLDYEKFNAKAVKHGLPRVLLFTSKAGAKTSNLTKFLSVEFRRRMLIAEIKPTKPNQNILDQFGITELPALIVIPPPPVQEEGEEIVDPLPVHYDGGKFTKLKLVDFLSKNVLKTAVVSAPKKKEQPPPPTQEAKKEEAGTGDANAGADGMLQKLMKDPDIAEAMTNPKVMAIYQKIMAEPGGLMVAAGKIGEYTSDPEIKDIIKKLIGKAIGMYMGGNKNPGDGIKVEL